MKNGLGDMRIINLDTGEEVDRDYQYVSGVVTDYEIVTRTAPNSCTETSGKNGTYIQCDSYEEQIPIYEWTPLQDSNVPKGTSIIGIQMQVYAGEDLDLVWEVAGKYATKHAPVSVYEAHGQAMGDDPGESASRLVGLWFLTNKNITIQEIVVAGGGSAKTYCQIINSSNSVLADGNVVSSNVTFNLDLQGGEKFAIICNGSTTDHRNNWGCDGGVQDGIFNFANVNFSEGYIPGQTLCSGRQNSFTWALETLGIRSIEGPLAPEINLESPANNTQVSVDFQRLNCSAIDGIAMINLTLFVDSSIENTITNSSPLQTTLNLSYLKTGLDFGVHNWTCSGFNSKGLQGTNNTWFFNNTGLPPVVTQIAPVDFFNSSNPNVTLNCTAVDDVSTVNLTMNIDGVANTTVFNTTTNETLVATTAFNYPDGLHNWSCVAFDNLGIRANSSTRFFTVDTVPPDVNLTFPLNTTYVTDIITANETTIELNWTVGSDAQTCWHQNDTGNTTVTCSDNFTSYNDAFKAREIIFYTNDSFGNVNSSSVSATWVFNFFENNFTFNGSVFETESVDFELQFSTAVSILSITANLNYNGTRFPATASCSGGSCNISRNIDAPLVISGQNDTNNFNYELVIFNGTESIPVNTTVREQNVTRTYIEECNATISDEVLNYTARDEQNQTRINPYNFDGTFSIWLGSGTVTRNNSFNKTSIAEIVLCVDPNRTYFVDAQIEYDKSNSTAYKARSYFLQNNTINSPADIVTLFLLKASELTTFILNVQNNRVLPLPGHIINIQKFFPGEGAFKTVQIAKTDDNGQTAGFFEVDTIDYRFLISLNNQLLLQTTPQKILQQTAPFAITFTIGIDPGTPWSSVEPLNGLNYIISFNTTTNLTVFTYEDSFTNFSLGELIIERQNLTVGTNVIICQVNSSIPAATLSCDLTGNATGGYIARGLITRAGEEFIVEQITFDITTFALIIGLFGVFLGWLIILTAGFAFKFNVIAGIWLTNMAVIFVNLIGFVAFGPVFITGMIAVSIIITVLVSK